ncbi:MAG TPA: class I SAM-dependent methyltransferase [Gemmatimonadales bacterium]|nr:class I SAM-dependent methyltransferase [Gemmatimonadales bacterium]
MSATVREVVDPLFSDPRLAGLYDDFDGARDDLDHYERIVRELGAHQVLDVGCGTGSLACLLTHAGFDVVGVDPAEASLDVARSKPGAEHVRWIDGYATTLPPMQVDLALMTGNVAQVFLTDEDLSATLCGIHGALRQGGHLVFESRRPQYRAWAEWQQEPAEVTVHVAGVGAVSLRRDVTSVELPLVSFRQTYAFPDGTQIVSESTLRFRSQAEFDVLLDQAGFSVHDVRDAPDRPGREFVFITQKRR